MYLARFKTPKGHTSLPIDRASLMEGMRLNGFRKDQAIRAVNNLCRGIQVIVGECVIEKINEQKPRWN